MMVKGREITELGLGFHEGGKLDFFWVQMK